MDMAVHHMYNFNNVEMFLNEIGMPLDDDFAGEAVIQNISGVATTLDSFFPIHGLPWEHFRSEITRFGKLLRDAEARWSEHDLATVTVNQFLADNLFPATFFRAVQFSLYKLSSAAASIAQLDMPVGLFAYIDRRTGITTKSRQRAYRQVVPNGTYSYVLRLADIFSDSPHVRVLTETTVNAVKHSEFGEVSLLMQHVGNGADFHSFDQVIFAIPKEQLSAVFFSSQSTSTGADNVYRYIFGAVSYTPVNIAAHTDSIQPYRRTVWPAERPKRMLAARNVPAVLQPTHLTLCIGITPAIRTSCWRLLHHEHFQRDVRVRRFRHVQPKRPVP